MKIRVLIAEDERFARDELEYLLSREDDLQVVASVSNGKEAVDFYQEHGADVIFLDIEMPELNGREAAKMLIKQPIPPYIVFTTAYEEYAVEAFAFDAIDYLLKPYDPLRLQESLARVRKAFAQDRIASAGEQQKEDVGQSTQDKKRTSLLMDSGEKLIVVKPETIRYAVKEERFVVVHTEDRTIQTRLSLAELEEKLQGHSFIRSHRSYLVNLAHVKEVEPWFNGAYNIILNGNEGTKIPVSRSMAKDVLQRLEM